MALLTNAPMFANYTVEVRHQRIRSELSSANTGRTTAGKLCLDFLQVHDATFRAKHGQVLHIFRKID